MGNEREKGRKGSKAGAERREREGLSQGVRREGKTESKVYASQSPSAADAAINVSTL